MNKAFLQKLVILLGLLAIAAALNDALDEGFIPISMPDRRPSTGFVVSGGFAHNRKPREQVVVSGGYS